jgi:hypothetical protein
LVVDKALFNSATAFSKGSSGASNVNAINRICVVMSPNLDFLLSVIRSPGIFGCCTDQVQRIIVARQDQRILRVPRVLGCDTQFTTVSGREQLVSHLVMPSDQKNNINSKGDCKSRIYQQNETKRGPGIRILTEAITITNNERNL